jgi:hypothetical protein
MKTLVFYLCLCFSKVLLCQMITVNADNYMHVFEGGGTSIGLFMGHHFSMDEASQDKAVQLMYKDCNMPYLQDYISTSLYPPLDNNYFDKRANYFKAAKQYRPDVKISLTTNRFPIGLTHEEVQEGKLQPVLNTNEIDIYDKVAKFYFDLFLGFKIRGVEIDILNVVNEPDFNKQFYYGQKGENKKGVALLFAEAVPKLKAMLMDTTINKLKMKIPQIMGPSTISPQGCLDYMRYFKQNYPKAWENIDIVATHQYINGTNEVVLATIRNESENKPFQQSEMHTNRGDNLGPMPIDSSHRGVLSLARLMGTSLRNGVNSWLYFQTNYPNEYTPAGLMYIEWQSKQAIPYQHYYAFQQMTSTQPKNSHLVERNLSEIGGAEVFIFRKKDEDTLYVNIANFINQTKSFNLDIKGATKQYSIKNYTQYVTDGVLKNELYAFQNFDLPQDIIVFTTKPYSVNTLKIAIGKSTTTATKRNELSTLLISPNPSNTQITIAGYETNYSLYVYNVFGKLMIEKHDMSSKEVLSIDQLPSGYYNIVLDNKKEKVLGKFIKN